MQRIIIQRTVVTMKVNKFRMKSQEKCDKMTVRTSPQKCESKFTLKMFLNVLLLICFSCLRYVNQKAINESLSESNVLLNVPKYSLSCTYHNLNMPMYIVLKEQYRGHEKLKVLDNKMENTRVRFEIIEIKII